MHLKKLRSNMKILGFSEFKNKNSSAILTNILLGAI